MIMHEPISVLLLLPHTAECSAKYFFYQHNLLSSHMNVLCVRKVNKIPVLSRNTITTRAENRERISFLMRALLCWCAGLRWKEK